MDVKSIVEVRPRRRGGRGSGATAVAAVSAAVALVVAGCTDSGHSRTTGTSVAPRGSGANHDGSSLARGLKPAAAPGKLGAVRQAARAGAAADNNQVQVIPASDRARQTDLVKTNCDTPVAGVTCIFTPTGPLQRMPAPTKRLARPYQVCEPEGFETVEVSDTTEVSNTLGGSVSVELGAVVKQAVEGSFGVTWASSQTTKVEDRMHLPAYSVGYVYRAAPIVRATGELFIRQTSPEWNAYQLVDVIFDAPDTSPTAQGSVAFVSRPMTAAEKAGCAARALARKHRR